MSIQFFDLPDDVPVSKLGATSQSRESCAGHANGKLRGSSRLWKGSSARRCCRTLEEILNPDRQASDAAAGRVVNRIGDRRVDADDADLANTLHPMRVHDIVLL